MADISSIRDDIAKVIPAYGSPRNPVDIVGDADFNRFEKVLNLVLAHPNVGSVVTMCTPSATLNYDDLATAFSKQPLPEGGVVIVSNAGGPAIISTDACSKYGL